MAFRAAGPVTVVIDDVKFAEPKFAKGANDFDICVHIVNVEDEAQSDWWRGEVSQEYGKGNFASMTQAEITMKTLRGIGFEGDDLTQLKTQLAGKKIPAMIKESAKDGKTYYNVQYIGGGGDHPVEIDADTMKKRVAALFGGVGGAAPAATATPPPAATTPPPAATTAKATPFGKAAPAKSPFGK